MVDFGFDATVQGLAVRYGRDSVLGQIYEIEDPVDQEGGGSRSRDAIDEHKVPVGFRLPVASGGLAFGRFALGRLEPEQGSERDDGHRLATEVEEPGDRLGKGWRAPETRDGQELAHLAAAERAFDAADLEQ